MELPEMPEEGYAILVTPENYDYLDHLCTQLGESGYFYPNCKALNIFRSCSSSREGWGVYVIHTLPSKVFAMCTLITEEQLKQLMFIYFLEK